MGGNFGLHLIRRGMEGTLNTHAHKEGRCCFEWFIDQDGDGENHPDNWQALSLPV
jgi:hypothetical protein